MIVATTRRHVNAAMAAVALLTCLAASNADAQQKPRPRPAASSARPSRGVDIGGYATFGNVTFRATQSFEAILGESSGPIFGGGARIGLPWGGLFVDVGAWRLHREGERAFVYNDEVYRLGIPVDVTVTPLEISGGWRVRLRRLPKFIPYVAGGFTSMRYQETSDFSTASEDVDENFGGYHVLGGAEYKVIRWLGVAGEASWSTIPDALGEGGVSQRFSESDLGGTTLRFKITVGR